MGKYNAQVKYWVDGDGVAHPYELIGFNKLVYGSSHNETSSKIFLSDSPPPPSEEGGAVQRDYALESRRRALRQCRDLATCNHDMNIFATLTLDSEKINRYSYDDIIKKANDWLSNRVRRNGLKYLIIPELHKDGAIHFHGLMNDVLERRPAGIKHHGKWVYNLPDWTLGFTTAQRITGKDCSRKVSEYVLKYITKCDEKIGGRYYLHGGTFASPKKAWYNIDIDAIGKAYAVAGGIECAVSRDELTISKLLTKIHVDEEI